MVLPVRIELTTSALPRMRSTTELRQHVRARIAGPRFPGTRAYGRAGARMSRQALPDPPPAVQMGPMADDRKTREEKLAEALRENLRKRKAQKREVERTPNRKSDTRSS